MAADGDLQREAGEGAASQPCKPQDSPAAAGGKAWQRKSQSTGEALCTFARKAIPSHSRSPGTRGLALAPHTGQPAGTAEVQTRVLEESSSISKLFPSTISPKWRLCSVLVGAQHLAGASSSFSFPLSANMLGRREGKEGEKKKKSSLHTGKKKKNQVFLTEFYQLKQSLACTAALPRQAALLLCPGVRSRAGRCSVSPSRNHQLPGSSRCKQPGGERGPATQRGEGTGGPPALHRAAQGWNQRFGASMGPPAEDVEHRQVFCCPAAAKSTLKSVSGQINEAFSSPPLFFFKRVSSQ